jgi:hypothetical protein
MIYTYKKLNISVGFTVSESLLELSGCHVMITHSSFPATTTKLLKKHIDNDAILVRLITDLSIEEDRNNIVDIFYDMNKDLCNYQCVLCFVSETLFEIEIKNQWVLMGGVVIQVKNFDELSKYIFDLEAQTGISKPVYSKSKAIDIIDISDWRRTISTFPGYTLEVCNIVRNHMLKTGLDDNLLTALVLMTNNESNSKASGLGLELHVTARKWLGLLEGSDLYAFNLDINQ